LHQRRPEADAFTMRCRCCLATPRKLVPAGRIALPRLTASEAGQSACSRSTRPAKKGYPPPATKPRMGFGVRLVSRGGRWKIKLRLRSLGAGRLLRGPPSVTAGRESALGQPHVVRGANAKRVPVRPASPFNASWRTTRVHNLLYRKKNTHRRPSRPTRVGNGLDGRRIWRGPWLIVSGLSNEAT
jgi:hypothetical protein